MRMLTASAIGLVLTLPLAVASAPARADTGDYYNQNAPRFGQQNDPGLSGQRADRDQYLQRDQHADTDDDVYGRTRYGRDGRHMAEGGENRHGDQLGYAQGDQYRHGDNRADQTQTQEAQRGQFQNNGDDIGHDRDTYRNDRNSTQYGHRPYDPGDSDRD